VVVTQLAGARLRVRACGLPQSRARAGAKACAEGLVLLRPPALRAAGEDRRGPARGRFRDW